MKTRPKHSVTDAIRVHVVHAVIRLCTHAPFANDRVAKAAMRKAHVQFAACHLVQNAHLKRPYATCAEAFSATNVRLVKASCFNLPTGKSPAANALHPLNSLAHDVSVRT